MASLFRRNPFKSMLSKRQAHKSSAKDEVSKKSEHHLMEQLTRLQVLSKNESKFMNLEWVHDALEILSEVNENLNSLASDLHTAENPWGQKWIDEYLEESLKGLDICNAIKSEISKMKQIKLSGRYAVHMLETFQEICTVEELIGVKESIRELVAKLEKRRENGIEICTEMLRKMSRSMEFPKSISTSREGVFLRALYGMKVMTIFICGVIACAFGVSTNSLIQLRVPDGLCWSGKFLSLQKEVHEQIRSRISEDQNSYTALAEIQILHAKAERVHSAVATLESVDSIRGNRSDEIEEHVKELQYSVEILSEGLDQLDKQVDEFFEVTLTGRKGLLDSLTASTLEPTMSSKPAPKGLQKYKQTHKKRI